MGSEKFSFFPGPINNPNTRPTAALSLAKVRDLIQGETLAKTTATIRKETDEAQQKGLKEKMPYVIFNGKYSKRSNAGLLEHSGLDVDDFDHVVDLEQKVEVLKHDPHTLLLWISPRGQGIKVVTRGPADPATHEQRFYDRRKYYKENFNLETDDKMKAFSQATFLCHDPDVFFNPDAVPFSKPAPSKTKDTAAMATATNDTCTEQLRSGALETLIKDMDPVDQGNRFEVRCPQCGQHEAYVYKSGDNVIRCAHIGEGKCNWEKRVIIGDNIAEEIDSIRKLPVRTVHPIVKLRKIQAKILKYLTANGAFLKEQDFGNYLYFDKATSRILDIIKSKKDNSDFDLLLSSKLGVLGIELRETTLTLQAHTSDHGQQVQVHPFVFFDERLFKLYVSDFAGGFYEISRDRIERRSVSIDGVLFKPCPEFKPYNPAFTGSEIRYFRDGFDAGAFQESLVYKLLISKASLADTADFSAADKRIILLVYFYSMFFRDAMPTRPILLFNGEKGSGKTFIGRYIGRALFGELFEVLPLPKDDLDLRVAAKHNPLIVLDNCDTHTKQTNWFRDSLATIATGSRIQKRQLYSDSGKAAIVTDTFIVATSRDPRAFQRDDIADRTIVFDVERIAHVIDENHLKNAIIKNRPGLWAEIIVNLQDLVALYQDFKRERSYNFRMADFARIMDIFMNDQEETNRLLNCIRLKSESFSIDDHRYFIALENYFAEPFNNELTGKASDIIEKILPDKKDRDEKNLPTRFSKWVRIHHDELKRHFDLVIEKNSRGFTTFLFSRATDPAARVKKLKERRDQMQRELASVDIEIQHGGQIESPF